MMSEQSDANRTEEEIRQRERRKAEGKVGIIVGTVGLALSQAAPMFLGNIGDVLRESGLVDVLGLVFIIGVLYGCWLYSTPGRWSYA